MTWKDLLDDPEKVWNIIKRAVMWIGTVFSTAYMSLSVLPQDYLQEIGVSHKAIVWAAVLAIFAGIISTGAARGLPTKKEENE